MKERGRGGGGGGREEGREGGKVDLLLDLFADPAFGQMEEAGVQGRGGGHIEITQTYTKGGREGGREGGEK